MEKNNLSKKIKFCKIALTSILVLVILYIVFVYALVFVPSFTRSDPTEVVNRHYFVTEENYDEYIECKDWIFSKNPMELSMESFDGLKLSAIALPCEIDPVGTIVLMHGYHSDPVREFALLTKFYNEIGYNVVLPYQRTHGKSEGTYITFGVKERFDLKDWLFKANEVFGSDKPLFVEGISMGCATSVMMLGCDNLPDNLKGVIADCGFTSPEEIIWKVLTEDKKLPTADLIMSIGKFFVEKLADFKLDEYSTYDAIEFNKKRENQIPILFIHGTKDDFVPIEMTERNFVRCIGEFGDLPEMSALSLDFKPNSQVEKYKYVQMKDSPHAISNILDREKYRDEVYQFIEKWK